MFRRTLLVAAVLSFMAAGSSSVFANHGWYGSHHGGYRGYGYGYGYGYGRPVVVAPRPIVVAPRPVVVPGAYPYSGFGGCNAGLVGPGYGYGYPGYAAPYGYSFSTPGFGMYVR